VRRIFKPARVFIKGARTHQAPWLCGVVAGLFLSAMPAFADCNSDSALQSKDLTTFVANMKNINNCSNAAGKAAFASEVGLLATLNQRNQTLNATCPASDPNWQNVKNRLRIQIDTFAIASKGCLD